MLQSTSPTLHIYQRAIRKKTDISTPEGANSCYTQIYHQTTGVAPSSKRIIKDVTFFLIACQDICYAEGSIVEKISSRTMRYGHRADAEREARLNPKIRGGAIKVREISDDIFDMHSDLLDLFDGRTRMLLNPSSGITHEEMDQELVDEMLLVQIFV